MIVFGSYNHCFGDSWAILHNAIRTSLETGEPVFVSEYVYGGAHLVPGVPTRGEFIGNMLREQLSEINQPKGSAVHIADEVVTELRKITVEEYPHPYYPTKHVWKPKRHRRLCVQFDNNQVPETCARSFKYHDRLALLDWLKDKPYVVLGKPLSVSQCAEIAATSDLFIGMDSGMSHLAHSVGVPTLLLHWEALDRFHPKKLFYRFGNAKEGIRIAEGLLKDFSPWLKMLKLENKED